MSIETYAAKNAAATTMLSPARTGIGDTVRPVGRLKDRIESLNRLGNMISEDIHHISIEIDRITGPIAVDPNKGEPARPPSCDLDVMQEQLDRLDRLAQFTRQQLDRLRSI